MGMLVQDALLQIQPPRIDAHSQLKTPDADSKYNEVRTNCVDTAHS